VLEAFVSAPPEGVTKPIAGFRDGNKQNFRPPNLYWTDMSEVMLASAANRLSGESTSQERKKRRARVPQFFGSNVGTRKLTLQDARDIDRALSLGVSVEVLAERYGISTQNVRLLDRRRFGYEITPV
jgi:hypothetical protein